MKKIIYIAITVLLGILFSACSASVGTNGEMLAPAETAPQKTPFPGDNEPAGLAVEGQRYRTLSPSEAKKMIGQEGVVLLDVRTKEEYEQERIPGSFLLPVDDLATKAEKILPDRQAVIIVYCRSGRRSAIAARQLAEMGYKEVYDLGGIQTWPYETVTG